VPYANPESIARARKLAAAVEEAVAQNVLDARGPFVLGLAWFRCSGDADPAKAAACVESSKRWFAVALERCRAQKGNRILGLYASEILVAVARLAHKQTWLPILREAADAYIDFHGEELVTDEYAAKEGQSPVLLWAEQVAGEPEQFYKLFARVGLDVFRGAAKLRAVVKRGSNRDALFGRLMAGVEKEPSSDAYMRLAQFVEWVWESRELSARVLLAARGKVTGETPVQRLQRESKTARLLWSAAQGQGPEVREAALAAAVEAHRAAEQAGEPGAEEACALYAARLHLLVKEDRDAARAILKRLIERGRATRAAHVAEVCAGAGMIDEALERYEKLRAAGLQPYFHLARLHEVRAREAQDDATRRRHAELALRYYNGSERFKSLLPGWPPEETLDSISRVPGASDDAGTGRAFATALLGGEDVLLEAYLKGAFPALTAEARKTAELEWRTWLDTTQSGVRRAEAWTRLGELGPGVVPVIRDGLKHPDAGMQATVRERLVAWAQPLPE
jgi:hypothetical protein